MVHKKTLKHKTPKKLLEMRQSHSYIIKYFYVMLFLLSLLIIVNVIVTYNKFKVMSEQQKADYFDILKRHLYYFFILFIISAVFPILVILCIMLRNKTAITVCFVTMSTALKIINFIFSFYFYYIAFYNLYYLNNIVVTQQNNISMN